jgi:hypothetical protein
VRTIANALGRHYVGLFDGCVQHSPRASVVATAGRPRRQLFVLFEKIPFYAHMHRY